ncbi:antibiotic biosynthesis monooxygenase [Paraconexibacter sp.]|uniref:antibiotic biosynthesis monooxygenase n=1 Tax=Paraconexibacter sp. TaxID=2949640 RepID=UPI00356A3166
MFATVRTYRVGAGTLDAVMHRVDRDFAESLAAEPGFISYQAIETGEDMLMTISVFSNADQAQASNDLAARWVMEELADFEISRVGVIGGDVMVSRASSEALVPAHH